MKVELTDNIVVVMEECNKRLQKLVWDARSKNDPCFTACILCPLSGACIEHFTGDDSANN